jgi:hypothetical protein
VCSVGTRYSGYGVLVDEGVNTSIGYVAFDSGSGSSILNPKYITASSGTIYPGKVIKLVFKCTLPTSYPLENSNLRFKIGVIFEGEMAND